MIGIMIAVVLVLYVTYQIIRGQLEVSRAHRYIDACRLQDELTFDLQDRFNELPHTWTVTRETLDGHAHIHVVGAVMDEEWHMLMCLNDIPIHNVDVRTEVIESAVAIARDNLAGLN